MTQGRHDKYNVQIIEFSDGSKYVTARTDARTIKEIESWKRNVDKMLRDPRHADKIVPTLLMIKLDTHTIRQITNVEGLQGISRGCALASKHALIKGLRAMGHAVINGHAHAAVLH